MIAANELRIGNWVKSIVLHGSHFLKFKRFDEDLKIAFFYKENIGAYIEHIAPIPLTTEILEKCGFYIIHHLGKLQPTLYIDKYQELYFNFDNGVPICVYDCENDNTDENIELASFFTEKVFRHINHLHQLQNLYFALTNTELTYTP